MKTLFLIALLIFIGYACHAASQETQDNKTVPNIQTTPPVEKSPKTAPKNNDKPIPWKNDDGIIYI